MADDEAETDMHSKMPVSCLIVAATSIWVIRSSSESTGDRSIRALLWLYRKESIGVRSGYLGGQVFGPPRSIQRSL